MGTPVANPATWMEIAQSAPYAASAFPVVTAALTFSVVVAGAAFLFRRFKSAGR